MEARCRPRTFLEPRYDHPFFQDAFRELNALPAAELDGGPKYFGPTMPARTTVQQIAPAERRADQNDLYPDLEQVSLIAVRSTPAH